MYLIATDENRVEGTYVPGRIITDTPYELSVARFNNVAVRRGTQGDFSFTDRNIDSHAGGRSDIRAGTYEVDDSRVFAVGVSEEAIFVGFEADTNYPIFSYVIEAGSFAGEVVEYILTSEPPVSEGGSGTYSPGEINTVDPYTTCFAPGTLIATPAGERAVETLKPGDEVQTADGGVATVRFVGMQRVSTMFGPRERTHPVRILAGALGENTPHTDLVVTRDHGMILDGVVCNAGALINGTSIAEVPTRELDTDPHGVVIWYHVETENHTALLANGAVAESFIDHVDRAVFGNYTWTLQESDFLDCRPGRGRVTSSA